MEPKKLPTQPKATPNAAQRPQIEEEEEYQEGEYYDEENDNGEYGEEELYGEEDPESEEGESGAIGASPSNFEFTKEEITRVYLYKKKIPEASKVCTHFITGKCKYGSECREEHNQKIKAQIIKLIQIQRGNGKKVPKETVEP